MPVGYKNLVVIGIQYGGASDSNSKYHTFTEFKLNIKRYPDVLRLRSLLCEYIYIYLPDKVINLQIQSFTNEFTKQKTLYRINSRSIIFNILGSEFLIPVIYVKQV